MRSHHAIEAFGQRHADALLLDDVAELLGDRRRAFARDDAEALVERQARLDAAHDDVDGVGEFVDELLLAALGQELDSTQRGRPKRADEGAAMASQATSSAAHRR